MRLAIWGAVEGIGETDAYGRVDVPGKASLVLPEGDASVYFEQGGSGSAALKSRRESVSLEIGRPRATRSTSAGGARSTRRSVRVT